MTTTLPTESGRHDQSLLRQHEPEPPSESTAGRLRPLGRIDRLALHVGVALIRWGRRPRVARPVAPVDWAALQRVREERERALERQHADLLRYRMTTPYR